ncbi:hypothetical protein INP83_02450 [Mucilaginibacter sp. 21P]|uniref:BfmA/BtgA family mobilization protein n=1 Tax=Mucilaginibacter sp. 21P TaxID=2778902 RepID=UPI001C5631B9|nr:BfmA/BtgA family mobilization protein [Mucilaginibacter sp. 21P]QXV65975.1 hypothetical protein INP83_02450 [Mucilaginibacter sp. 21P]
MGNTENNKTVRFTEKTDERLIAIARKNGLSKLDAFVFMVDYFYKTKKDPRDLNDELLKNAINRKTDNIVAFIKRQEQDLLIPIKKDGERTMAFERSIMQSFKQDIADHNQWEKEVLAVHAKELRQVREFLSKMDDAHLDKSRLKKQVSEILEYYIRQREKLGMLSSQADKDVLMNEVRQRVQNL